MHTSSNHSTPGGGGEVPVIDLSVCMTCWTHKRNVSYSCPSKHLAVCEKCHWEWMTVQYQMAHQKGKIFNPGNDQTCPACHSKGVGTVHEFTFAS